MPWLSSLQEGIDAAQRSKLPILVDVGAEWCGWCHELDKEIAKPEAQAKLAQWTRVRLDADKDGGAVRSLAVGPIPALRVLSPLGRVVASRDGYLPAADLIAWLDQNQKRAAAAGEAVGGEPADADAARALADRLTDPDPVVREAVARRLARRPDVAAAPVVEAFAAGKLATRLAALELLQEWDGPTAELDPWQPATITPQRIDALKKWADAAAAKAPATRPADGAALSPAAAAEARRDLTLLLQADTDAGVRAARERAARAGAAVLPEVYAALKAAATDRDRERLTALRYRAVASDALAVAWPWGFDQLASADAPARRKALDELASKAGPADAALLLELFSHPDPLVREGSLRLLQSIGGEDTTAGLARLLRDPEPNVRAAVLKQLAEKPVPGMDARVIEFVQSEADTDLVVHGIRVLREAKSDAAAQALRAVLSNESWRVRAEAAEALGAMAERSMTDERKADVYADMIGLLQDPDGFVASRAMGVLKGAQSVPAAVDPLAAVAEKRPELAAAVVETLTKAGTPLAAKHLRRFGTSPDPAVRAAAVAGLATAVKADAADALQAALQDPSSKVRLAAAKALVGVLEAVRPNADDEVRGFFGLGKTTRRDMEAWLAGYRAGSQRPRWLDGTTGPLEQMLAGTAPGPAAEERLAAAVALAAAGRDEKALPVLREAMGGGADPRRLAADALPWLAPEDRVMLFKELAARAGSDELAHLATKLAELPGPAAVAPLWDVLAAPAADASLAGTAHRALLQLYLGQRYYDRSTVTPDKVKLVVDAATPSLKNGAPMQRLVALALLADASPPDAVTPAEEVVRGAPPGDPLRADAFRVLLLSKPDAEAEAAAVAALGAAADGPTKKIALTYLCSGADDIHILRESIWLSTSSSRVVSYGQGQAIKVEAPKGIRAETLKPLLADPDPATAGYAGYLLCALGDRAGLDPLLTLWRQSKEHGGDVRRLVYRAVAALNDDALVPVLDEVYKSMGTESRFYAREFYWTIRGMAGPNVLALRKRVRDEVGMQQLQ